MLKSLVKNISLWTKSWGPYTHIHKMHKYIPHIYMFIASYNLRLLHFLIIKYIGVLWKKYFIYKCITLITPPGIFFITPLDILWLENIIIQNYNWCKLLTLTKKIEKSLNTRSSKLLTFTKKNRGVFEHVHHERVLVVKIL